MRAILSIAAAMSLVAGTASAQFDIEDSTTASQEVKLEILNTIRTGSIAANANRNEHEFGVTYGALEGWAPRLSFLISNPNNGSMDVTGFRFSSVIGILGGEVSESDFSLGFYSGVFYDFDNSANRYVELGPSVGYEQPDWSVALNTFATIPLNDGDVGFNYAVGGSYKINEMFAVGAEAHGTVSSVFEDVDISSDEHVVGPTMTLALETEGRDVALRLGTFFGLTDAAPTMAISANLELGF